MLNRIILIGRLTKDVELRYTQNGTAVASFTLAVNRRFQKDETDFIDIVVWKGLAENCANYLGKGSQAAVEGRLQIRTYENKDGQKRKVAEVIADNVEFLDSKGSGKSQQKSDKWDDLGREVNLKDVEMGDNPEDEIPF